MNDPNAYAEFVRGQRWRQDLYRKATYKALDIPEDAGGINVKKGLGWQELMVVAVLMVAMMAVCLFSVRDNHHPSPVDSAYDVRFYDSQGNVIPVERLPR